MLTMWKDIAIPQSSRNTLSLAHKLMVDFPVGSDGFVRYISTMNVRLVVEHDPDTDRWSAVFPEIPGCASAGDTEEEAIANAREALALWFEPVDLDLPAGAKVFDVALT